MGPVETLEQALKVAVMPADLRKQAEAALEDLKGVASTAKPSDDLAKKLTDAALEHSANTGEFEMAVGDLEILLSACLGLMSEAQRGAVLKDPGVADLLELPEYEKIFEESRGED